MFACQSVETLTMSVNISKVFISYFFFIVLAWKFKLGFFFVFFTPAVSFWPSFFAPPSSCCDSRLSCCALNLRLRADDVLFLKKQKKKHEIFSVVCAIYALNLRCVFSLFLYTHFKEIKVHLFFINTFLMKFCCQHKSKELKNAGSERNLTWPVMWR